ncbi:Hypothetical protein ORPV_344 [Orpheovirus IHUMI-LCC2]|uniref:F-box domain-containing protein n=1 Tax=Orpheovirus IHUMI-LCC2 TaxID=2023057 RepID=A0A2I2L3Z4_9VIRU|nr:Hypothetical protein ORPV_344 [Orpheovirus IHUMI-LCC2]SNW62248.1 Hypothetical protein ORPV_344 [Orpheovirus IHUMI-LCC2]
MTDYNLDEMLSQLPPEISSYVLSNVTLSNLYSYCSTEGNSDIICQDDNLWKKKILEDLHIVPNKVISNYVGYVTELFSPAENYALHIAVQVPIIRFGQNSSLSEYYTLFAVIRNKLIEKNNLYIYDNVTVYYEDVIPNEKIIIHIFFDMNKSIRYIVEEDGDEYNDRYVKADRLHEVIELQQELRKSPLIKDIVASINVYDDDEVILRRESIGVDSMNIEIVKKEEGITVGMFEILAFYNNDIGEVEEITFDDMSELIIDAQNYDIYI